MEINGRAINEEEILRRINRQVERGFLLGIIKSYLMQNPKILDLTAKGKIPKKFVKDIRRVLHKVTGAYGLFEKFGQRKRDKLLELGKFDEILKTNKSTRERSYGLLYEEIFSITGRPKTVLDLGAGINPVSLHKYKDIEIISLDINKKDVDFLNKYFAKTGCGRALLIDLNNAEKLKKIQADIGLMFKVVDVLDLNREHGHSEEIIKNINVKWLVISFATKTLGGRDMNFPYRGWFDRMLERLGLKYKTLIKPNEIFYVVRMRN